MSVLEIAKLANVSTATVSRVINNSPNVSEERIRKVEKAIKKLGYIPNPRGRSSAETSIDCVGLLIISNHMFDPYSSVGHALIKGAQQSLKNYNMEMILSYLDQSDDLPDFVKKRKIKGIIAMGHHPDGALLKKLELIPTVWMTSHSSVSGNVVLAGNEAVGKLAAEYLVSRGHKQIAVLNVLAEAAGESRARFFRFVAKELGASVSTYYPSEPSDMIWEDDVDLEWFENAVTHLVDQMLLSDKKPTGLFVPSDFQVAMLYRVLNRKGIRPGIDIEIIGTDEEKGALMGLYPRPATINIGARTIGKHAVEHLMMKIERPDQDCVKILIEPHLIPGESIKPADL